MNLIMFYEYFWKAWYLWLDTDCLSVWHRSYILMKVQYSMFTSQLQHFILVKYFPCWLFFMKEIKVLLFNVEHVTSEKQYCLCVLIIFHVFVCLFVFQCGDCFFNPAWSLCHSSPKFSNIAYVLNQSYHNLTLS